MCGLQIVKNGRINGQKSWHDDCLALWKVMSQPSAARAALMRRDRGHCAICYAQDPKWEADHKVPLLYATKPWHWSMQNLATLCKSCHNHKTKMDRIKYGAGRLPKSTEIS